MGLTGIKGYEPRLAYLMAFLMILGTILVFQPPATAGHGTACLDVRDDDGDETDTNPVGTTHTLTAQLRTPSGVPSTSCTGQGTMTFTATSNTVIRFEFETGPTVTIVEDDTTPPGQQREVIPQDDTAPSLADASCTIPMGQSTCTIQFSSRGAGTNRVRGWIEGHPIDETEPRDEATEQLPMNPQGNEPDTTDVVEKTWTALAASRLDCSPETDSNSTGDAHTITCTARDQFGNPVQNENVDAEATGANDPDSADGGGPDFSCTSTTNAQGQCSFTNGPGGTGSTNNEGTTTYRAWLDQDNNNSPNEADASEGRCAESDGANPDEQNCANQSGVTEQPGATAEPDRTDVVTKTWVHAPLNCFPEFDVNPSGSSHTITCTARNSQGQLAAGILIDMEAFGANPVDGTQTTGNSPGTPDFTCTTDSNGSCSMTHGPGGRGSTNDFGTTTYRAWVDEDGDPAAHNPGSSTGHGNYEGDETEGPNSGSGGDEASPSPTPSPSGTPGSQPGTTAEPDKTDVVQKFWTAGRLDCNPETDTNPAGTSHVITCLAQGKGGGQSDNLAPGVEIHVEATGANDPDGSESFNSPDFICTTNAEGRCTITHGPGGTGTTTNGGTTAYTAWIDVDAPGSQDDATVEADQDEGRAEGTDQTEPDNTDVVEKTWIASRLDCSPEADTNPAQSAHTITCSATDAAGTGQVGVAIDAEATGANDTDNGNSMTSPDFSCVTGSSGQCSFTHGPGGRGTTNAFGRTLYRAWIDADGNDATTEADVTEGRDETTTSSPSPSPSPTPTRTSSPAAASGSSTTTSTGRQVAQQTSSPSPTSTQTGSPRPTASPTGTPAPTGPGTRAEPDDTDVVEKNWSAVPSRLRIDPETDSAPVGSCNAFTITATDAAGSPVQNVIVDVEQRHERADTGAANDEPTVSFCTPGETDGANPSAVDASRGDLGSGEDGTIGGEAENLTDANGKVTIGIRIRPGQGSNGTGNVLVTAFYENEDNDDPDSGDPQDSSTKTWTPSQARTIDCEPEDASNRVGREHVVTCTVRNANGDTVQGEGVTFTEDGPGSFTSRTESNTDANGQVTGTTTSDQTGTQTITGTLTTSTQGEPDTDECDRAANDPQGAPAGICSDTVEKEWRPGPRVSSGPCRNFTQGSRTDRAGGGQVIVGTNGPDTLRGTPGRDVICGLGGSDTLIGRGGGDLIVGNRGNDTLRGGGGADRLRGGAGRDTLSGGGGNDDLNGGAEDDTLRGGGGRDTLAGRGGDDTLKGQDGNDTLDGGRGNDVLDGDGGTDTCRPSPGQDRTRSCEK